MDDKALLWKSVLILIRNYFRLPKPTGWGRFMHHLCDKFKTQPWIFTVCNFSYPYSCPYCVSKRRARFPPPQPSCPRNGQRGQEFLYKAWTQNRTFFFIDTLSNFKSDNKFYFFSYMASSYQKHSSLTHNISSPYLVGLRAIYFTYH